MALETVIVGFDKMAAIKRWKESFSYVEGIFFELYRKKTERVSTIYI